MISETVATYLPLPWDSRLLGFSCGVVNIDPDAPDGPELARQAHDAIPKNTAMTLLKLPASHPLTLASLMREGARMVGTECAFVHPGASARQQPPRVVLTQTWEHDGILDLAREMRHSRLFLDSRIPEKAAMALWRKSIRNHCRGRSSILAVAKVQDAAAGLVAAIDDTAGRSLFLVGVLPAFRRRGLALEMLQALVCAPGPRPLRVEAMACNAAALELYGRAGFRLQDVRHVVHIWHDSPTSSTSVEGPPPATKPPHGCNRQ